MEDNMNAKHKIFIIVLFGAIISNQDLLNGQTTQCGGSGGSAFILPSTSNVNALIIYTRFPSGGFPVPPDELPSFADEAAQHLTSYYEEMSYNTHHINAQVIERSAPFVANNPMSYYQSGFGSNTKLTELNTEILNKAYQENNNVFNGISVVFLFYGGNVFTGGTAWADLYETSPYFSGCGAIMEWGWLGSEEEEGHKCIWHMNMVIFYLPMARQASAFWIKLPNPAASIISCTMSANTAPSQWLRSISFILSGSRATGSKKLIRPWMGINSMSTSKTPASRLHPEVITSRESKYQIPPTSISLLKTVKAQAPMLS
jgi:hypothetical protein